MAPVRSAPRTPALALALAAALVSGCAREDADVRLRVSTGALDATVARVEWTVEPGEGPAFAPITAAASRSSAGWEAWLPAVPAGAGRVFSARALDGLGALILSGSARSDVAAGARLSLVLVLQAAPAAQPAVRPPFVSSLAVWNPVVAPGEAARLQAIVSGDPGDVLEFAWTSTAWCGAFSEPDALATTWSSVGVFPSTVCPISFRAAGLSGGSVEVVVPVVVSSGAAIP